MSSPIFKGHKPEPNDDLYSGPVMRLCPRCDKEFCVEYPQLYVYKRSIPVEKNGKKRQALRYFCSWSCYRAYEKEEKARERAARIAKGKFSIEEMDEAVDAAMDDRDPVKLLAEMGYKEPRMIWYKMKRRLWSEDRQSYWELPEKWRRLKPLRGKAGEDDDGECEESGDQDPGECVGDSSTGIHDGDRLPEPDGSGAAGD